MARPRIPSARRPACPKRHDGEVWLDGFYARGEFHERPRFVCVPRLDPQTRKRPPFHADGSKPHKFDLMALDLAKEAKNLRYREIIRSHLLRTDGRPTRTRRALDDHAGSSLHQAVKEVETRLKWRREQNARAQRAHVERLKQSGQPRARTPSRRARNRRATPI